MSGYDPQQLLSVEELCELWGVKKSWVYDEVEAKRLPVVRLGRQLRFRRAALDAFLDAQAS